MRRYASRAGCSGSCLRDVKEVLDSGGLIIYPTDTAYALGADAENPEAVDMVYRVKLRPRSKPLTIAVAGIEMAKRYARLDDLTEAIMRRFLPGPVTFILPKKETVPDVLNPRAIGIRVPASSVAVQIIEYFGRALTATSANISGNPPPFTAEAAAREIPRAEVLVDVGRIGSSSVSTIVDLTVRPPELVRDGPVDFDEVLTAYRELVGSD